MTQNEIITQAPQPHPFLLEISGVRPPLAGGLLSRPLGGPLHVSVGLGSGNDLLT